MKHYRSLEDVFNELEIVKQNFSEFYKKEILSIQQSIYQTLQINNSNQCGGISSGLIDQNDQINFFDHKIRASTYATTKRERKLDASIMTKLGYGYNFDQILEEQFPLISDYLKVEAQEDTSNQYNGKRYAGSKSILTNIPRFDHGELLDAPFGPFPFGKVNDYDSKSLGLALVQNVYSGKINDNLNHVHRQGDHTRYSGSIGLGGVFCKLIHDYVIFDQKTVEINLYTTAKSSLRKGTNGTNESPAIDFVNKKLQEYITLAAPNFEKLTITINK